MAKNKNTGFYEANTVEIKHGGKSYRVFKNEKEAVLAGLKKTDAKSKK